MSILFIFLLCCLEIYSEDVTKLFLSSSLGTDNTTCTNSGNPCKTLKYLFNQHSYWNKSTNLEINIEGIHEIDENVSLKWNSKYGVDFVSLLGMSVPYEFHLFDGGKVEVESEYGKYQSLYLKDKTTIPTTIFSGKKNFFLNGWINLNSSVIEFSSIMFTSLTLYSCGENILRIPSFSNVQFSGCNSDVNPFLAGSEIQITDSQLSSFQFSVDDANVEYTISLSSITSNSFFSLKKGTFNFFGVKMFEIDSSSSFIKIGDHAIVNFDANDQPEKIYLTSLKNSNADIFFEISDGAGVKFTNVLFSDNIVHSRFFDIDSQSLVSFEECSFIGNKGVEIFKINDIMSSTFKNCEFKNLDKISSFLLCEASNRDSQQQQNPPIVSIFFVGKNTFSPKIPDDKKVSCSDNCQVNNESCQDYFDWLIHHNNDDDKKKRGVRWYVWGIPTIVSSSCLLFCCFLLVICGCVFLSALICGFFSKIDNRGEYVYIDDDL